MTAPEFICLNGECILPSELGMPLPGLLSGHYVYQRIHIRKREPLHPDLHLSLARKALTEIYGMNCTPPEKEIGDSLSSLLKRNKISSRSHTAMLFFLPANGRTDTLITDVRPLLNNGYSVSSLRPTAVSEDYDIPFQSLPTNFMLSAAALFDERARASGATRNVRSRGDALISCGDAPLFGIKGKTLFTAPITEGGIDSVERRIVISAANGSGMEFLEEAVPKSGLRSMDELFYADAAGITSLSECDGVKLMSLMVNRLVLNMM